MHQLKLITLSSFCLLSSSSLRWNRRTLIATLRGHDQAPRAVVYNGYHTDLVSPSATLPTTTPYVGVPTSHKIFIIFCDLARQVTGRVCRRLMFRDHGPIGLRWWNGGHQRKQRWWNCSDAPEGDKNRVKD